ncbi:hypothetical protein, partial [Rhizobium leguminosarum]|uniref:hypothetical protein n=1 Tax=Rhizobium leguminosarum TaxID=384 RepID=UPI003F9D73A5
GIGFFDVFQTMSKSVEGNAGQSNKLQGGHAYTENACIIIQAGMQNILTYSTRQKFGHLFIPGFFFIFVVLFSTC